MHTHIYHTHTLCLLILQGLLGYLLGPRYWSFMWSCFSPVRFLLPVRLGRQAGHMKRFTQGFHSKEEAGFQTRVSSVPIQCYFCCRKPGRWFYPNQILGPHPRPTELGCPPLAMVWILTGDQEDAVSKRPVSLACWAYLESYPSCYALGIFFFFSQSSMLSDVPSYHLVDAGKVSSGMGAWASLVAKTREPLLLKELVTMETAVPISSLGMLDDMFVEVGKGIVSCECEAALLSFLRKVGRQEERRMFGGNWNCPFAEKTEAPSDPSLCLGWT